MVDDHMKCDELDIFYRFSSCEEYMEKMNPSDVTMFVKQLVLSSEAAKMVPLEARMEYCQKVIKFSNEQEGKEQVSAAVN